MNLTLMHKTALVCGGSRGIGLASAQELSGLGCRCILVSRNRAHLDEALKSLPPVREAHTAIAADLGRDEDLDSLIQTLGQETIHILINNSGGPAGGPVLEAEPAAYTDAFRQHLVSGQRLATAVVPGMRKAAYGRIINILSTSVKAPLPNLGVSNTTRWAVAAWAKTLAGEVAPWAITVNNVLPGSTQTDRLKSLVRQQAENQGITEEAVENQWLSTIPMGRFGHPEEIAALVAFLASPAAAYITGTSIQADGGKTPVQ